MSIGHCSINMVCHYYRFPEVIGSKPSSLVTKDSNLCAHALKTRAALVQRNQPFPTQQSPLSELQLFVKQARKALVDPILARFEQISSPESSSSEEEADPEEVRRQQEREKIRYLKNKKIYGSGPSFPTSSTLSLKPQGSEGVFIRRDVDDETMDVDIDLRDGLEDCKEKMNGDLPLKGSSSALVTDTRVGARIRRPTIKKAHLNGTGNIKGGTKKSKSASIIVPLGPPPDPQSSTEDVTLPESPPEDLKPKRKSKGPKPKPETYKQSWSVSEQNLLEQLLEEIPDGEKFRHVFFSSCTFPFVIADPFSFFIYRWQKISRAMGGKRTPRQVASRVQKYFEKLKRFGIGVT